MTGREHIQPEDLALHALGGLTPEEAATVRAHLDGCGLCSSELDAIRRDLGLYALAAEPVELPSAARARFLKKLGREQQLKPAGKPARRRWAPALAWVGWAAAAGLALVAVGLHHDRDMLQNALRAEHAEALRSQAQAEAQQRILGALTSPASVHVTLALPKAPASPAARATYAQSTGTLLLQASNLQPLPPGKVYELWIIPANGGKPIAAGTFAPDVRGNGSLLAPAIPGATAAKAFGITAEPTGGSPSPTLPILLSGSPS